MASSKIKRNQSAEPIYWVLGAITIAGVVFMLWPQKETYIELRAKLKFSGEARAIVNGYLRWNEGASAKRMTIKHEFTAEGLGKMAGALSVLSKAVSERVNEKSAWKIDSIKKVADLLIDDIDCRQHAEMLRGALIETEDILSLIQYRVFPELKNEVKLLNSQISMIKADRLLLEQKSEIITIFHQIANILKEMTDVQPENASRLGVRSQKSSLVRWNFSGNPANYDFKWLDVWINA